MWRYGIPFVVFVAMVALFWQGLGIDPRALPSALIDRPLPEFTKPDLLEPQREVNTADWTGEVALVNVWATWCSSCRQEHDMLMTMARDAGITLYGVDYKDDPATARSYLAARGNPYADVVSDEDGRLGMDLGVYGTPETFVIDHEGTIRYKHVGPMTEGVWQEKIAPLVEHLAEAQP